MSFTSLKQLESAFAMQGCEEILIKPLAQNQDNEKNQIYLGYSNQLFSIFPGKVSFRAPSSSTDKRGSKLGKSIIESAVELYWLQRDDAPQLAPNTKIIDYFQYPEMRLSGFLSGCKSPPDALRRNNQDNYGQRVLVVGIAQNKIFDAVITQSEHTFIEELLAQPASKISNLFKSKVIDPKLLPSQKLVSKLEHALENYGLINPDQLLRELKVLGGIRHPSTTLKNVDDELEPFRGTQGAGYTLESLLNIPRNSSGLPDKYGFELKTYLSTKITLMTPEPDFGYRHDQGLTKFLAKFGWDGTKNDGSRRFNGKHTTLKTYSKSGLSLEIEHWDTETNSPNGKGSPNVLLINSKTREIAAGWSFEKLAEKWGRKHAGAMYVQANKYLDGESKLPSHYSFGPDAFCGIGTSPLHLLRAIALGNVYLDPGDRVNLEGQEKKRTQWRIDKSKGLTFGATLAPLYDEMQHYVIS